MNNDIVLPADARALEQFISLCRCVYPLDPLQFRHEATKAIAYYRGAQSARVERRRFQELENKWYDSLERGEPDYSVYSSPAIVPDIWACWATYSRTYLRSLLSPKGMDSGSIIASMGKIRSVVDMGCGISYTTASLSRMFPHAKVYGTNVEGSIQFKIGQHLSRRYQFTLIPDIGRLDGVDLVFASEYFEHWEAPVEHLLQVLQARPKVFILANAFGTHSLGHFDTYLHKKKKHDGRSISKLFSRTLIEHGYAQVKTHCWNNRPAYWMQQQ